MCACVCRCGCVNVYAYVYVCMHVYMYMYVLVMHVCTYVCMYISLQFASTSSFLKHMQVFAALTQTFFTVYPTQDGCSML